MTVYRIANWNTRYENNRSRELKDALWFPCPNVFDGDGYCYMIDGKDGPLAYCGWILLCGVASRCTPRGILVQTTGHPHTADTIAAKTRVPAKVIRLAIDRALHTKWLEPHDGAAIPHEGATYPAQGCDEGAEKCDSFREKGKEEKRREENSDGGAGGARARGEVQERGAETPTLTPEQIARYRLIAHKPDWMPPDRPWIDRVKARDLACLSTTTPALIRAAVNEARQKRNTLSNPAGLVVKRLEDPDPGLIASLSGANTP